MVGIDRDFVDKEEEVKIILTLGFKKEERDLIDEQANLEGFTAKQAIGRNLFIKKVLLEYCKLRAEMKNKEKEIEKIFIEDYANLRREYLEKLNKFKKYREQMKRMITQDEGGDPFDDDEGEDPFDEDELVD